MKKLMYCITTLIYFAPITFCDIDIETCEKILIKHLTSADNSTKIYILENLTQGINLDNFVPILKKMAYKTDLQQVDDNIRIKSAYLLAKVYKDTAAVNVLINILETKPVVKNPQSPLGKAKLYLKNLIRAEAVKMLGEVGNTKIVALLWKYKNDPDGTIVDAVYFVLYGLMLKGKIALVEEIKEFFYSGLKDLNPKVRLSAVKYLGELRDTNAVQPLMLRLKDSNKEVCVEAITSLCKIGSAIALQDIIYLKNNKEDSIRAAISEGLGFMGRELLSSTDTAKSLYLSQIKKVLIEYLNDYNGRVRINAAVSLLMLNDYTGIEIIKKGLNSTDTDVVIYCIKSLGEYGTKNDISLLEKFVSVEDPSLQVASTISILKILSRK